MKRSVGLLIIALSLGAICNAQYRINHNKYQARNYHHQHGDPYSPVVAGIASGIIPGLGQMILHEVGRGFIFLGGTAAGEVLLISESFGHGNHALASVGASCMVIGYVWSIFDAVHVAKINDLAYRDKKKLTFNNIRLQPVLFNKSPALASGTVTCGISLRATF